MNFAEQLNKQIEGLKQSVHFNSEPALRKVVELLMETKTVEELIEESGLITRIIIDSVSDLHAGDDLLAFINNCKKARIRQS